MKTLYILLYFGVCSINAQVNDSPETLKEFNVQASKNEIPKKALIESILKMFGSINAFEYSSERNNPSDIVYEKVLWKELASDFYFELLLINRKENSVIQRSVSFIDNQTCTLFPSNSELHIQKGKTTLSSIELFPSPLIAFSFTGVKGCFPTLNNIKKSVSNQTFNDRIFYQREELWEGKQYSVFRILSVYDYELREELTYEIFIHEKTSPYPSIWKAYDS